MLFVLVGCTSIVTKDSSPTNVVIQDHFISGSGYSEAASLAGNYCRQYGAKAVFNNKKNGCLFPFCSSEYNYYSFDCIKNQHQAPYQPPPQQVNKVSIDDAKEKCKSLGLQPNTENFGNCVLRLTK
jgi:hypothetical protein